MDKADTQKNVIVVCGGPAGCMAILVATNRGQDVTLYEEGHRLGGVYRLAVPSPSKKEVERFFSYFERALSKAGVDLKLETAFTAKSIYGQKPDVVLIAVGAVPAVPRKINGIDGANVAFVDDVMAGRVNVGNPVGHCDEIGNAMKSLESAYDTAMQI